MIACIEDPAIIERILAHLKGKAPSVGGGSASREPCATAGSSLRLTEKITYHLCHCATCIGAVGILLACRQELGRNQGKAGRGAKNQRRNGLAFGGEGADRLRFSRCRLLG
jgi:hypothetical protein